MKTWKIAIGCLVATLFLYISTSSSATLNKESNGFGGIGFASGVDFPRVEHPPLIEQVSIEPENPSKEDPIQVTAKVSGEEEILETRLFYSLDGWASKEEVPMEMETEGKWTTTIGPFPKAEEIVIAVQVEDVAGQWSTEVPITEDQDSPVGVPYFPVIRDELEESVQGYLDLAQVSFAASLETFYAKIELEGKVNSSINPDTVPFYRLDYFNLDESEDDPADNRVYYRPNASEYLAPVAGLIPGSEYFRDPGQIKEAKLKIEDNILYLQWKREKLGPKKILKLIGLTGIGVTDTTFLKFWPYTWEEITPYARIYLREHKFKLKGGEK